VPDETAARTTVTQRAIEEIKAKIATGELSPGQRLPTERDLAADLGLSRIDENGMTLLRAEMTAMERGGTAEEIVGHDLEFHRIITEAAGNPVLAAILGGLNSRTFRARVWRGYREEGVFPRTFHEHDQIYRALVERDPDGARVAAAVHIGAVEDWARRQAENEDWNRPGGPA
jgi:DNA-binding FadR family transcriptional regulator